MVLAAGALGLRLAIGENALVASFANFQLQSLRLGPPKCTTPTSNYQGLIVLQLHTLPFELDHACTFPRNPVSRCQQLTQLMLLSVDGEQLIRCPWCFLGASVLHSAVEGFSRFPEHNLIIGLLDNRLLVCLPLLLICSHMGVNECKSISGASPLGTCATAASPGFLRQGLIHDLNLYTSVSGFWFLSWIVRVLGKRTNSYPSSAHACPALHCRACG